MRRLINHDEKSGYTTIRELTLSSTTGVNRESYISLPSSDNTENDKADTQVNLLNGIVDSLSKIADNINAQKQGSTPASNMIIKTIDVDIDNIASVRQFISVNNETVSIPDNTLIKSIKLDIERSFPVDTQFVLFFNNEILATINVVDSTIHTYEMQLDKTIIYSANMGNNMNIEVFTDPGDPSSKGWTSAKATMHLTVGLVNNEI